MLASLFTCLFLSRFSEIIERCFAKLTGSRRSQLLQWIVGNRHQLDAAVQLGEAELLAVATAYLLRNRHTTTFVCSYPSTHI